jgi:hypothetical protein
MLPPNIYQVSTNPSSQQPEPGPFDLALVAYMRKLISDASSGKASMRTGQNSGDLKTVANPIYHDPDAPFLP